MNSNLMEAMIRNILEGHHDTSRWHGWKPVPTVESFRINLGFINGLLEKCGITRRQNTNFEVEKKSTENMNRYIRHQLIRAEKARDSNPALFWTIAFACIDRSVSFRTSAYNRVFPQWWHEESISQVWIKLRRISRIIKTKSTDLEYRRVYIPKGDSDFRPLGVPSGEWRVVMHMHNNWLTMFLRPKLEVFNHGYLPGRGSVTAWKDIITNVLRKKYIYEFDLKQFFPGVNIDEVTNILQKIKVPKWYTYHLENINRMTPTFPKDIKLDESVLQDRYKVHASIKQQEYDPTSSIYNELQHIGDVSQYMKEDGVDNLFEWVQLQWALFDSYGLGGIGTIYKGLPQGLNTSPILSILTLAEWAADLKRKGVKVVMYADDGVLASNKPFRVKGKDGIEIHPEKSKWLKRDGKWLVDSFKFLGVVYNTASQMISGNTRKGSKLSFTTKTLKVFDLLKKLKPDYDNTRLERLAHSNLLGVIMSKLYTGSWEPIIGKKEPWVNHKNSWWGKSESAKASPTVSSSAAEYLSFVVKMTI